MNKTQYIRKDFCSKVDHIADYYYVRNGRENAPCVVVLHGHGSHGDQLLTRPDLEGWGDFLEENDFSVISPNLRNNAWMSVEAVSDLVQIIQQEKNLIKYDRLILASGSMGGTGNLIFAALHPELVDGVVALGASSDLERYGQWLQSMPLPVHQEIRNAILEAYSNSESMTKHSVLRNVSALQNKPVFLAHGGDDEIIPVEESRTLAALLQGEGKPFCYREIPGGDHDSPLGLFAEGICHVLESYSCRDWRKLLSREQERIHKRQNFGAKPKYQLCSYYLGKYRMEHPEEESLPETLRHANAFCSMLKNLPLHFSSDQEFFGGVECCFCDELPPEIPEKEYEQLVKYYRENYPQRNFTTGHDHVALDYEWLCQKGLGDYLVRAEAGVEKFQNPTSLAMLLVVRGVLDFFRRAAESCRTSHPEVAMRLEKLSLGNAPETLAEAIQLVWLLFVLVEADGPRYHNALARIDQYLNPFWQKGGVSREQALYFICHLWTKVEEYHETTNICIGGSRADGSSGVNELSFLALKATHLVHSASTNLSARLSRDTSEEFLLACVDLISTGIGFPAVFNDHVNTAMLQKVGIPLEAARDFALFGCVEPLVAGRQVAWSDGRFSMPKYFMEACYNLKQYRTYDELFDAFTEKMYKGMQEYAREYNAALANQPVDTYPDPVLSAFVRDCIGRGKDINDDGAEFPRLHGVGMMGLATLTDSLVAIKKLMYEEKRFTADRLLTALESNYENDPELRSMLINCAPKYGNDIEYCDEIAQKVVQLCGEACLQQRTLDGGFFLSCMASNIDNIPSGKQLGATPDGRLAGEPLSDAASPYGGRDHHGPTAFVNSIVKPDYTDQACTVVNMRFLPEMFRRPEGRMAMLALLRRFIDGEGQEMQFNVTDNKILEDAMVCPEKYADLIVRVSGFSAFFIRLDHEVQLDILRRTTHGGC